MSAGKLGPVLATMPAMLSVGAIAAPSVKLLACADCRLPLQKHGSAEQSDGPIRPSAGKRLQREDMFRFGDVAAKGLTDNVSTRTFFSGRGGFTIDATRQIARRPSAADRPGASREKLSAAAFLLRYGSKVGKDDMALIGLSASVEKRRFAFDLSGGHPSSSRAIGVEVAWGHGPSSQFTMGYRRDFGSGRSAGMARSVELASGAARTQHGPWAAIAYSPGDPAAPHNLSVGVKLQAMQLGEADRLALGGPSGHDERAAFTAAWHFR